MATTRETVEIVVTAKDEATKALSGIGSAFATAVGTFAGGAALKGFDLLSGAVMGGISDARDAAKVFAQTQTVIESTGGAAGFTAQQIADMAGSLSAASGKSLFGDDDIERGQNMLLTFTNITDLLPDTTQTMIDMAQALGTDAGGAAVQLGKALNDPIAGISALSRVGVSFTDEQKEQIKTMQEAGNMAGAQTVILNELNKEFGGSALAAAQADGGMAQLKDSMGELAESIGTALLPLISQFIGFLNSPEIQAGIAALAVGLVEGITAATTGFQAFLTTIQPIVGFIQDNLTAVLAALAAMLLVVVVPAFIAWATAAGAAAIATITALAPVLLPIAAIGAAVGLLVTAWDRDWGGMRTTLTAWWTGTVEPLLTVVKGWIDATLPIAVAALRAAWDVAWAAIGTAVQSVYSVWSGTVWPWIQAALSDAGTWIATMRGAWEVAWQAMQSATSTAYAFFHDTVWPWIQTATGEIGGWMNAAQAAWSAAWALMAGAVATARDTIKGIIDEVKIIIQRAIDKVNTLISLINAIPGVDIPTIPGGTGTGGGTGGGSTGNSASVNALSGGGGEGDTDTSWSGGQRWRGTITINQSFAPGTAASIRKQARLGASQGVRAAARSQGLL